MTNDAVTYPVTPDKFVYGGETLGRLPDGRAVFIPYTVPGEEVLIRLTEDKKRYARGEVVQIQSPGEIRTEPRCRHYGVCGGCHYQHLEYEDQLTIKENVLRDQLTRIGKCEDPTVRPTVPSPQPWYYRNQVGFQISPRGELGFIAQGSSSEVMPVEECHLLDEVLQVVWPTLNVEAIPGLDRVFIRSGEGDLDALLVLESSDPQPVEFAVDYPISVVHRGPGGQLVLSGDEFTVVGVHGYPFVVSAGSFFQVNLGMAEKLIDYLLDELPLSEEAVVLDVYCGVGLFSVFLAPYVKKLIGIEASPSAAEDFMYNLGEFENVELYPARAEEVLPALDLKPEIVLVDPPRGGISGEALDAITALEPECLCYVSCDPATLGRDVRRLQNHGYHLQHSTPFDMFPQTYHLESVNLFQK